MSWYECSYCSNFVSLHILAGLMLVILGLECVNLPSFFYYIHTDTNALTIKLRLELSGLMLLNPIAWCYVWLNVVIRTEIGLDPI